jgi:hypothetical protein
MGRSEPDAGSLHPTQQFSQKRFVPVPASILGFLDRHSYKMHEEDDSHYGSGRKSRRGHRLRRPQAAYAPCHAHA